jgi:Fur family ferric uptake transcriptional regulator
MIGEVKSGTRLVKKGINRSTVYPTISLFVKQGLVNAAENETGERTFEIAQEKPHHHLICKQCGAEVEIENQLVEAFYQGLKTAYSYQVEMDHLIVFGLCAGCAAVSGS